MQPAVVPDLEGGGPVEGVLELDDNWVPFQPKPIYDSVILKCYHVGKSESSKQEETFVLSREKGTVIHFTSRKIWGGGRGGKQKIALRNTETILYITVI